MSFPSTTVPTLDSHETFPPTIAGALHTFAGTVVTDLTPKFGATGARPASPVTGQAYFDTTLGLPVFYSGTTWVNATGTPA